MGFFPFLHNLKVELFKKKCFETWIWYDSHSETNDFKNVVAGKISAPKAWFFSGWLE